MAAPTPLPAVPADSAGAFAAPSPPAPQPVQVKICGVTRAQDAELAVEMGAWAVGMIFYEGSPRRCSIADAAQITATFRRRVELCGVFVNESLDRVAQISDELGLTLIQLHGDEGPAFCGEVARRTGARIIRAAQVSVPGDVRDVERYHVDYHLLDARSRAKAREGMRGGTGETFDWDLISLRRSKLPLILSGGIDAANAAAAISQVHPFALDSASGTESAPGHKDPKKLAALFDAVRAATAAPVTDAGAPVAEIGQPA
jgi:phosphoribosylanthranilate isomerase